MPLDNETPGIRNNPMPTPKDEKVTAAHDQAEKDIEQDDELNMAPDPTADLDEGEMARFEDEGKEGK